MKCQRLSSFSMEFEFIFKLLFGGTNYIIVLPSPDCSLVVILLFVLIKYTKTSYFVPLDYIRVVGIQAERPPGNPQEKHKGVPKGFDEGGVIKGTCMCLYKGCKTLVVFFITNTL